MWPRIFYAFDDTMSCWGAAEGLGEIGRNVPRLRDRIMLLLRKFQRDASSCQGYVWAVTRIGQVDPGRVGGFVADFVRFLDSPDICMAGQAMWALGELRVSEAAGRIRPFLGDGRRTWVYDNETARVRSLSEIASEALAKL